MIKFKVGDKVRVVGTATETRKWIGEEFTVSRIDTHGNYPIWVSTNAGPFYENELELVNEQTLEQQLEEARTKVAELEKQIKDAKPKAKDLPAGSVIDSGVYQYVKAHGNGWFAIATHDGRYLDLDYASGPYKDDSIHIMEVIREGI